MQLYTLLCQEVGTRPEDRRLLRALSRSCSPSAPRASFGLLQATAVAVLAFAAFACAARFLA